MKSSQLPDAAPLAWIYINRSAAEPELHHGREVEVFEEGFFEGCYAGDWKARDYDQVREVFGSGMRLRNGLAIFVPPSHTLEALYIYRTAQSWAVSNSLAACRT
jgi:hypothetical protein